MAMPVYYARKVWLAAVAKHSGEDDIEPDKNWEEYLSDVQLKAAQEDVNKGLALHGWKTTWRFTTLRSTNPINKQWVYLADTSEYVGKSDPLYGELAKLSVKKIRNK